MKDRMTQKLNQRLNCFFHAICSRCAKVSVPWQKAFCLLKLFQVAAWTLVSGEARTSCHCCISEAANVTMKAKYLQKINVLAYRRFFNSDLFLQQRHSDRLSNLSRGLNKPENAHSITAASVLYPGKMVAKCQSWCIYEGGQAVSYKRARTVMAIYYD